MARTRAGVVLCLMLFAGVAVVAASLVEPAEFDLVSGHDWATRAALADDTLGRAAQVPALALQRERGSAPAIASGWILLAGGLIVTVLALVVQARGRLSRSTAQAPRLPGGREGGKLRRPLPRPV